MELELAVSRAPEHLYKNECLITIMECKNVKMYLVVKGFRDDVIVGLVGASHELGDAIVAQRVDLKLV